MGRPGHEENALQRRRFLHTTLAASAGLGLAGRLFAAPAAGARLLLVFLRGGYDATSLLVPLTSSFYREVRPNIAIPPAATGVRGATALTTDWGLHPALEASIAPLAARRQACFVPFAGTDDLSRSHFETQDTIELGQGSGASRDFGSGFMNRLAAVLAGREAIAFTAQLPLVFRGSVEVANTSLKGDPRPGDARLRDAVMGMYRDHPLQARVAEAYEVRDQLARQVAAEKATVEMADKAVVDQGAATPAAADQASATQASANQAAAEMSLAAKRAGVAEGVDRNAINARGFEREARRIARLMRERYALGFVDVGGWDTHVGQGAVTGYLAGRLDELGRGLASFADEIGADAWRDTVVVVISEFGRTLRENGNRGTDHGHGSVYWVLGGGLATGPVAGEQQLIDARTLFQNRDLPVLNDYRAMLGGLFARQFGLTPAMLGRVFPGAAPRDFKIL
jgi:uncharacterized protein (DUF1501 family)